MKRLMHVLLAVSLLTACLIAYANTGKVVSNELDADHYDCSVTLTPPAANSTKSAVRLQLEAGAGGSETRVTLSSSELTIEAVAGGKVTRVAQLPSGVQAGTPYPLTILRRGEMLAVLHGEEMLFHGPAPHPAGSKVIIDAEREWAVGDAHVQQREPVVFADNFMRTADEPGQWKTQRGQWALQSVWDRDPRNIRHRFDLVSFAANPFAWVGRAATGSALCLAGKLSWDDYTLTTAVQPALDGAVGVAVNMTAPDHGLLVRWTPVTDRRAGGNMLSLCRMDGDTLTELAQSPGGYLPGQWYRLAVVSDLGAVHVLIDGQERLTANNVTPWHGSVGLYSEGENGAIFDDVTAYGRTLKTDLIAEHRLARFNERFQEDHKGLAEFSTVQSDWLPFPNEDGYQLHRLPFYGDHWLTLPVKVTYNLTGAITMILNGNGTDVCNGYRVVVKCADGKFVCTLYRDTDVLATKSLKPLTPGEEYTLRCWHTGRKIGLDLDNTTVLVVGDAKPLDGHCVAYALNGAFLPAGEVVALGHNLLDYAFTDAPVDWLAAGTWMPTNRWSCSSQWSFLGGWSRGDAVLWHKDRFAGDQYFEAFVATKMEYPRERQVYWSGDRIRDYAITICGDGHNPRSGYTGIYGASQSFATPNRSTVLLRNGVQVAVAPFVPHWDDTAWHTDWYHLELRKSGATVELWVNGRRAVSYTDPAPIDGGTPAVWTTDNGIAVARARIAYANAPMTRTDPQVSIDDPWYPSWANVGRPLSLDFPHACSSSGKPVQLQMTPREAPAGENAVPEVKGTQVTLTPKASGDHWYQIVARDGAQQSPPFHLTLPVFNPALGRDDSHALVLYRFDEGSGNVIKDHGISPPADIAIPANAPVAWKGEQGLWLHGLAPLKTAGGVPKLMALARNKAATIELWIDTDTLYPPTDWLAGLLAWELPREQRNIVVAHAFHFVMVAPNGTTFEPRRGGTLKFDVMRAGLQHMVITWDGKITRCYMNGEKVEEEYLDWHPERWSADAPLLIGSLAEGQPNYHDLLARFLGPRPDILANERDMQHCYLGTFYLAAMHDRCFTAAEVQRHYQAGPSAR